MIPKKLGKFSKIRGTFDFQATVKIGTTTVPVILMAKHSRRKNVVTEIEEKLLALFSNWEKVQALFLTGARKALARSGYHQESRNLTPTQITVQQILIQADDDDGDGFVVSLGLKNFLTDGVYVDYSNSFDLVEDDNGCEIRSLDD
jgi:hypothetical protein